MQNAESELRLWRAVIETMLNDLGSKDAGLREDAEAWFCITNEDFLYICDLVDIDPNILLDSIENNSNILRSTYNQKTKVRKLNE